MTKCIQCNKKAKISRKCPALNTEICSTCCGTKRGKEISCTSDCKYYIEGVLKENKKNILKLVKESFNEEYKDPLRNESIVNIVGKFEIFILENFYNNPNINDDILFDCFMKMYYDLENKKEYYYAFNDDELRIVKEFYRLTEKSNVSIELQKTILLRLMKSIEQMTGGRFGNRMYLELLRGQFWGTGMVGKMFDR